MLIKDEFDGWLEQLEQTRKALGLCRARHGRLKTAIQEAVDEEHKDVYEKRLAEREEEIKRLEGEVDELLRELPRVRQRQQEMAELLVQSGRVERLPADRQAELVAEIRQAALESQAAAAAEGKQFREMLKEILAKLDDPGRTSAAKLKVMLPLIPGIVSWEVEAGTGGFVTGVWKRIKALLGGKS